jgi:transcriptional regulator with XRE-family HTH domain
MDTRNALIARGMRAGLSQKAIAEQMGISGPAIAQRIRKDPELRALRRRSPRAMAGIRRHRQQLHLVLLEARAVARRVRKALQAIDEELEAAELDDLIFG